MKKKVIAALIATMMLGNTLTVDAAGLKDIFNAKYYADQYQDLYNAFGYDEDALYQHFLTYGLGEGRVMNPIIDVVKYREKYGDLDTAFDDNWDAYVNHYFEFGINEKRDNGTDFDIKAYVEAYDDIKEAFGDDYQAIAEHYVEYGMKENRVEASKAVIAAREEAKKQDAVATPDPLPAPGEECVNGIYTDYNADGSWVTYEYLNGNIMKAEVYAADGTLIYYKVNEWSADNKLVKYTHYNADGTMEYYRTNEFNADGKIVKYVRYNSDGSIDKSGECVFNADGSHVWTTYNADGSKLRVEEFTASGVIISCTLYYQDGYEVVVFEGGKVVSDIWFDLEGVAQNTREYTYNADGSGTCKTTYAFDGSYDIEEFDGSGKTVARANYNAEGACVGKHEFDENGNNTISTYYDDNGDVRMTTEYTYNADGKPEYWWNYYADGSKSVTYVDARWYTTKEIFYYTNGNYQVRLFEVGDTYSRIARETIYTSENAIIEDGVYEYDEATGREISYRVYDGAGNLISETLF